MATKNKPQESAKSAKPGSKGDESTAPQKKGKVHHPLLKVDADGKPTEKLESVPDDFDPKVHKPLRKSDFASEASYLIMRAEDLEQKAKGYRDEAELIRKGGGKKAAAKAKRLQKMQERMDALKKELEESGIDTAELLSTLEEDE